MKPRLEPAPYADEDRDIWVCVGLWPCFALNDKLEMASAIGDRRDADLMWKLGTYTMPGHPPVAHLVLRVDPDFRWSDLLPLGLMHEEEGRTE